MCLLYYLQNFQTFIAGIIGFTGVIVTLLVNARLTRKIEKEKIDREANALRRALIEEMNVQCEALKQVAADAIRPDAVDHLVPVIRFSGVFDAAIERLGLLERQEVAAVLKAYLALKPLTPKLQMIASRVPPNERGIEYAEKPTEYILIGHGDIKLVGKMHESYIPAFKDAIKELELRSKLH